MGAIRTHEWDSEQGRRSRPQVKAEAVAPNLARGVADFRKTSRAAAPAPGEPASPDDPSTTPDRFTGSEDGRDYEVGDEAFGTVDTDDLSREPAHA